MPGNQLIDPELLGAFRPSSATNPAIRIIVTPRQIASGAKLARKRRNIRLIVLMWVSNSTLSQLLLHTNRRDGRPRGVLRASSFRQAIVDSSQLRPRLAYVITPPTAPGKSPQRKQSPNKKIVQCRAISRHFGGHFTLQTRNQTAKRPSEEKTVPIPHCGRLV